jgi:LysM repeat protein
LAFAGLVIAILVAVPSSAQAFSLFDALASLTSGVANAASTPPSPVTDVPALKAALNHDPNPLSGGTLAIAGGVALAPSSGPSGTLADVDGVSSGKIALYVVRNGDTIGAIGKMYGVSVNTIIWANDLGYKGVIHPGDTLVILPVTGIEYTTKKGDTLASLAKKFSADAGEVAQYNGLDPAAALAVGTDIIIPNGEIAAPPAVSIAATIRQPLIGANGPTILGYYGSPVHGVLTQGLHGWNGVDIGAPRGTPVLASAAGTVIIAREAGYNGGLGQYVAIGHPNGTETLYAHASKVLVSVGQNVVKGQTIMLVGNTGLSTGPHVHFEVRGAANPFAGMPTGVRF